MSKPVHIRLLGELEVEWNETSYREFGTRKAASLLAYLALRPGKQVSRSTLASLLWPESDPEAAFTSLRSALYRISQVIAAPNLVEATRTTVALPERVVQVDVADLEIAYESANRASSEGDEALALQQVEVLAQGSLLDGLTDEWILPERMRLDELMQDAFIRLAANDEAKGEYDEAIRHLRSSIALNPLDEPSRVAIMRVYARSGNRSQSLDEYEKFSRLLHDQLDLLPRQATRDLAERISDGVYDPKGDQDLLEEVIDWYMTRNPARAAAFLANITDFWMYKKNSPEGLATLEKLLEIPVPDPWIKGRLHTCAGGISYFQGYYDQAIAHFEKGEDFLRAVGDKAELLFGLSMHTFCLRENGEYDRMEVIGAEALAVSAEVDDPYILARFKNQHAGNMCQLARYDEGLELYEEVLTMARSFKDLRMIAIVLFNISYFLYKPEHESLAFSYAQECLEHAVAAGDVGVYSWAWMGFGFRLIKAGRLVEARNALEKAIRLARTKSHRRTAVVVYEIIGQLLTAEGEFDQAAAMLGAATSERLRIGAKRGPFEMQQLIALETPLIESMGKERFEEQRAFGEAGTPDKFVYRTARDPHNQIT